MTELTPIQWAIRPLKHYAELSGRAPRAEYWWYILGTTLAGLAFEWLDSLFGGMTVGAYGPLSLISTIMLLVPGFTVTVRRLHDIGRSGWWMLLSISWYGLLVLPATMTDEEMQQLDLSLMLAGIGFLLVSGVVMLVFMITRGDEGSNRYGPDPYGPDELEEVFA